jgi:hypothetical protein
MTVVTLSSVASCVDAQQLVERLLRSGEPVVLLLECDDLAAVDAVARIRLLAHRYGGKLAVVGDRSLVGLCGLDDVV